MTSMPQQWEWEECTSLSRFKLLQDQRMGHRETVHGARGHDRPWARPRIGRWGSGLSAAKTTQASGTSFGGAVAELFAGLYRLNLVLPWWGTN